MHPMVATDIDYQVLPALPRQGRVALARRPRRAALGQGGAERIDS